jgi:hypothetical protein
MVTFSILVSLVAITQHCYHTGRTSNRPTIPITGHVHPLVPLLARTQATVDIQTTSHEGTLQFAHSAAPLLDFTDDHTFQEARLQ